MKLYTNTHIIRTDPEKHNESSFACLNKILRNFFRCDFHKEVRIMSQLRDPNIVQVLGVLTEGEPLGVIVEYMTEGDLNQFLQSYVLDGEQTCPTDKIMRY